MPDRLKIVFVGGGSVAWTPSIMRDMLLTPALANAEFVLLDVDKKASDLTKAFLEMLAKRHGVKATFTSTNRPEAMRGAGYVVITISTGGFDAMAHDLSIPERFGIYHTVGDTSGPGGWARLIRNFDVFVKLARDINLYCRGAVILNYTNPMTTLTDVLSRLCEGPLVGLCHGLFENLELITKLYKLDSESEIAANYGGINHFFWMTQAKAGKTDVIADLRKRLKTESVTDLLREAHADGHRDAMGFGAGAREVATELFRSTGVMPYLGDRHTSEFFPCYITSKENLKKYRLIRTTIGERRRQKATMARQLKEMVSGRHAIPDMYDHRTRETAADIIEAHSQGKVFIDVGNVPNIGQISNLPPGLVVETAVRVDRNGVAPIAFGALPPIVKGFIDPYAQLFPMVVDACFKKDKAMALKALRLDPVCSHFNGQQVVKLGEKLLGAHRQFISAFA